MEKLDKKISSEECTAALQAVGDALYAIGGKWKLRLIIALLGSPKRFNELQRTVKDISARVLSYELKELEMNGFIKRIVYDETPVIVEYELTGYSNTLSEVLSALTKWGTMHRQKIKRQMKATK